MHIGNVEIGRGRTYIVAEIGINHNGELDIAKRLIDAAVDAGCNAVKFQKRAVDEPTPVHMRDVPRDTPWGVMTYLEYRQRVEFSIEQYGAIDAYCRETGIDWFVSVWDTTSYVAMKENFPNLPAWKIPSALLTQDELLTNLRDSLYRRGKDTPIILSTGMSTVQEISHAFGVLATRGSFPNLILCHSTSAYPCPPEELNLRCIQELRKAYHGVPIGYSGHETGLQTTVAAVALGACLVERHITLDRAMWGTDQAASVEPGGLKRLVRDIRVIEQALGDGVKRVYDSERPAMAKLRKVKVF